MRGIEYKVAASDFCGHAFNKVYNREYAGDLFDPCGCLLSRSQAKRARAYLKELSQSVTEELIVARP